MDARAESGDGCGGGDNSDGFGSLLDEAEFSSAVQALPPEALTGRAYNPALTRKMLDNLPAVAEQGTPANLGSPGSCEAQSFGYGLGSYTASFNPQGRRKWNPGQAQNSVSAAYLYELAHSLEKQSCPKGSLALGYLAQLTSRGAPTRDRIPYKPYCSYLDTIPSSRDFPNNYPDMSRFRIGSYATLKINANPDAVGLIKGFLQNGQAVAFSGKILCGYGSPKFDDGVIYDTQTKTKGGHGQLLVGYDDTAGKAGKKGALLVQNSFGVHWPPLSTGSIAPPGMAYWSYDTFTSTQLLAAVAYPRREEIGPGRLRSSSPNAPVAAITRSYQWAPQSGGRAYLILDHVFKDPIKLNNVSLVEPGGSPVRATAVYGQFISSGYSYLKRDDGKAFLAGPYEVTLKGVDLNNNSVSYTGRVVVGASAPLALPGSSMRDVKITGSTGAPATVASPP